MRSWRSLKGTGICICFQTVNQISISSSTSSYSASTPNTFADINLTLVVKKPKFNGRKKQKVEIMLKLNDKIKPEKKVDKHLKNTRMHNRRGRQEKFVYFNQLRMARRKVTVKIILAISVLLVRANSCD
jgi:hypothetical protein